MPTDAQNPPQQLSEELQMNDMMNQELSEELSEPTATVEPAEAEKAAAESLPTSEPSLEETEGEAAPFAGFDRDPGLENDLEAGSNEEASEAAPIEYRELNAEELQAAIEASLFLHHKPITISRMRELINPSIPEEDYRTAISNLQASYFDSSRGIELAEVANGFQLRTKVENKDILRRMYQIAPMKLTNAMLEVLAIAAYNQPLTREGIDRIRGVDSSHLVRVLLDKKMLRIVGKSDEIGRPMIYGTTKEFLELFGLRDLGQLPSLRDIEDMLPKNEVGAEISEEEALAKEMEGIVESSNPLEFNDLELEEELERHESQKAPQESKEAVPAHSQENSHSGPTIHGSQAQGGEAEGDLHLPPEVAGRIPLGPEGNA